MLYSALMLMMSSAFLMLRLSPAGSFPKPLNAEEESKALAAWKNGDKAARDKLIEHNLRLVAHITKKYYAQCDDMDDLISIGTIGLIKAISTGAERLKYHSQTLWNLMRKAAGLL